VAPNLLFSMAGFRPGRVKESDRKLSELSGANVVHVTVLTLYITVVFCFVGLFPLGILFLRIGNMVRGHAIIQGIALLGVVAGAALGITLSFQYNRVRNLLLKRGWSLC
jgi:hypothetical protein